MRPPFRADHVGSLLRPAALKKARAEKSPQLGKIEDGCIREAVRMQEAAGLQAVTDGEFRRAFWHVDFLTGFDGIVATQEIGRASSREREEVAVVLGSGE